MIAILQNIIASIIYDASKGIIRIFNNYLNKAFSDTCIYFSQRELEPIELNQDQFRKVLLGELLIDEVEKLELGVERIDVDKLALNFAIFSGLYLEDESKLLTISKEVLLYFINKFEQYLLEDKKQAPKILKAYIEITSNENLKKSEQILAAINILENQLSQLTGKIETLLEITPDKAYIDEKFEKQEITAQTITDNQTAQLKNIIIDLLQKPTNYQTELNEINQLLNDDCILIAREKALDLKHKIERNNNSEELFLINAYIAQSFLNSQNKQEEAIEYLEEAIKYCSIQETIHRNKAIIHLIKKEYTAGLNEINNAILLDPSSEKNTNIKVNLLVFKDDFESAIRLIPDETKSITLLYLKAWIYFRSNDFINAIEFTKQSLNISPDHVDSNILYGDIIIHENYDKILHNNCITDEIFESLSESLINLEKVYSILNEKQPEKLSYVSYQLGLITIWLSNFDKAKIYFETSVELAKDNLIYLRNLGFVYISLNQFQNAIDCFQKIKTIDPEHDTEIDFLLYECYLNSGDPSIVIEKIEYLLSSITPEHTNIRYYSLLIEAYDRLLKTSKAEEILNQIEIYYHSSPELIFIKAQHLNIIGKNKEAIQLIESVIDTISGKEKTLLQFLLGDLYYKITNYKKASEVYRIISNKNIITPTLKKFASSLYFSGDLTECLTLCQYIHEKNGPILPFYEYEGFLYFNSDNFIPASSIFRNLSIKYPNKLSYKINYGLCVYRLGKYSESIDIFKQVEFSEDISANELNALSHAFSHIGDNVKALELAYRAIEKDDSNPQIHLSYIFTCLKAESSINNTNDKYKTKYLDCIEHFNDRFPDVKAFEKKTVSLENDDFLNEFKKNLREQAEHSEYIEHLYTIHRFPICFLSKTLSRNIIQVWSGIISYRNLKVIVSSGVSKHRNEEYNNLKSSGNIIIDIVSILTLNHLQLLDSLHECFDKIYVCQSTIDIIQGLLSNVELSLKNGHLSFSYKNGNYFKDEFSAENVEKYINHLKKLLDTLNDPNKFSIIGKTINREELLTGEQLDYIDQISNVFPIYIIDIIIESYVRKINVYLEEFTLRAICSGVFNIRSFETQSFLLELLNTKKITEYNYQNSVIKLIELNYYFISITEKTLIHAVESNLFVVNTTSLAPFTVFRYEENDVLTLIDISIKFLRWLWYDNINLSTKITWSEILLEVLIFNRDKQKIINTINVRKNEIFSPLTRHIEVNFIKFLNEWKTIHLIV